MNENLTQETLESFKTEKLFDNYSYFFEYHLLKKLSYRLHTAFAALVQRNFDDISQFSKVLDVGCGSGLIGYTLRPIAHFLHGIDLSSNMLTLAESKSIYDELFKGCFKQFNKANLESEYDFIACIDTLAYFSSLPEFFHAATLSLSQNGYLALSIEPTSQSQSVYHGRKLFNPEEVEKTAQNFSFTLVDTMNTSMRIEDLELRKSRLFLFKKHD